MIEIIDQLIEIESYLLCYIRRKTEEEAMTEKMVKGSIFNYDRGNELSMKWMERKATGSLQGST